MASTLTSSKVAATVMARKVEDLTAVWASYELTAALVINDVIQMVKVPAGATILDVKVMADDLDTGSSPAIVLAVGDGTTADRFITGSTIAQGGGIASLGVATGLLYQYTADDTIDVKITTAPATGATEGTIAVMVLYSLNQ